MITTTQQMAKVIDVILDEMTPKRALRLARRLRDETRGVESYNKMIQEVYEKLAAAVSRVPPGNGELFEEEAVVSAPPPVEVPVPPEAKKSRKRKAKESSK